MAISELDFTTFYNIIDGNRETTKQTTHSIDPSTEEPNWPCPLSTLADVDAAVSAARGAFSKWAATSFDERASALEKLADAIESHRESFASLLSKETGKASFLADDEVVRVQGACRSMRSLSLQEYEVDSGDSNKALVRYVPVGVGAALVPWNFPWILAMVKIASAVYAGCTIIVKPSPYTPYSALKLVELAQQCFPPGVIQALSGEHDLGQVLTEHPGIDAVSFTGSVSIGKKVMASCAKTLKRVNLELGGNDAAIVCEDADLEKTVPAIAQLAFLHAGQVCMAIKRLYVHDLIYDAFMAKLIEHVKNLPPGFISPVQNAAQREQLNSLIVEIAKSGQKIVLGGGPEVNGHAATTNGDGRTKGYHVSATIVDNPPESSRIMQDEPFGPILPIARWQGSDENVIDRANDTEYGLGASVWSADVARAEKMARKLHAGSVWVNMHFYLHPNVPFGGHKNSGIGSECGLEGVKVWTNVQSVWTPKA